MTNEMQPTDAIGQPLECGDMVAYVHRFGSSVYIERRQIDKIRRLASDWSGRDNWEVTFVETKRKAWARAYNCVKVKP